MVISAQRIVLPGQDLFHPFLNDPSYVGENYKVEATGIVQVSDSKRKQTSQYLAAQMPIYQNVALGMDYFKDSYDYLSYSNAHLNLAIKLGLGDRRHYIKLGGSGGVGTQRRDRIPLSQITDEENFVLNIDDTNFEFTYRLGLHYTNKNFSVGGFYNVLPIQNRTAFSETDELLEYDISQGYTGYLQYQIRLSRTLRITPIARYLSYSEIDLYEGALNIAYKDWLRTTLSYKNEYSLNPALQLRFFKTLFIGYSYEKAIAKTDFEDVHSLSLSYRFKKGDGVENSEWLENAEKTLDKIEANKPIKKKSPTANKINKEEPKDLEEDVVDQNPSAEEVEDKVVKEEVAPLEDAIVIEMSDRYYLVAKSFESYQAAHAFKKKLNSSGIKALVGVRSSETDFHVFIDSDLNSGRAQELLQKYRQSAILKEIYILEPK